MLLSAVQTCVFHIFFIMHVYTNSRNDSQLAYVIMIAHMMKHCTGIAEAMGSIPDQAWIFSGSLSLLLK